MEEIGKEVSGVLQYLLPGFIAAWIFYGFTSHPKPGKFERVIQALIFTFFAQAILIALKWLLERIGSWMPSFGPWNHEADVIWSVVGGLIVGFAAMLLANFDFLHSFARRRGWSTTVSYPSEWYEAFHERISWVVLHLDDDRRLFGWPRIWPSNPKTGHFIIDRASWEQGAEGTEVPQIVIRAKDVRWVEFFDADPKEKP
jgi:hypothetical protein